MKLDFSVKFFVYALRSYNEIEGGCKAAKELSRTGKATAQMNSVVQIQMNEAGLTGEVSVWLHSGWNPNAKLGSKEM